MSGFLVPAVLAAQMLFVVDASSGENGGSWERPSNAHYHGVTENSRAGLVSVKSGGPAFGPLREMAKPAVESLVILAQASDGFYDGRWVVKYSGVSRQSESSNNTLWGDFCRSWFRITTEIEIRNNRAEFTLTSSEKSFFGTPLYQHLVKLDYYGGQWSGSLWGDHTLAIRLDQESSDGELHFTIIGMGCMGKMTLERQADQLS